MFRFLLQPMWDFTIHPFSRSSVLARTPLDVWLRYYLYLLDDESPTSVNLGNDHEFINKKYSLHWDEIFWKAYAQSRQYYTIMESHVCLTVSTLVFYGPETISVKPVYENN